MKKFSKLFAAFAVCGALTFGFNSTNVEAAEVSAENVVAAVVSPTGVNEVQTQDLYGPPPHRRPPR